MSSHATRVRIDREEVLRSVRHVIDEDKDLWAHYRVNGFFEDGYPRCSPQVPTGNVAYAAHPLHGAYLINRLVARYDKSLNRKWLDAAILVLNAALGRMTRVGDTLIFEYRVGDGINLFPYNFYSGLTQARYLNALVALSARDAGLSLDAVILSIMESLCVPVESGGVMLRNKYGCFIEEYPAEFPSYVLNGWLTTLNIFFKYALVRNDSRFIEICRVSAKTVASNLSRYDVPEQQNSFYKLSAGIPIELHADCVDSFEVLSLSMSSSDQAYEWEFSRASTSRSLVTVSKLHSNAEGLPLGNIFKCVALASCIDIAGEARVKLKIRVKQACNISIFTREAEWSLKSHRPREGDLVCLRECSWVKGDLHEVEFQIPNCNLRSWLGCTPFGKSIGGRYYNAYHFIHVKALSELMKYFESEEVMHYRDKWFGYILEWPSQTRYSEAGVSLLPYGCNSFEELKERLL